MKLKISYNFFRYYHPVVLLAAESTSKKFTNICFNEVLIKQESGLDSLQWDMCLSHLVKLIQLFQKLE